VALTLTAAELRDRLKLADDVAGNAAATRLLALATEAVNRYARGAPSAVANEAATRFAGYTKTATAQALALRSLKLGEAVDLEFRPAGSALRLSGAMALLAPYRQRRAPGSGDDDD